MCTSRLRNGAPTWDRGRRAGTEGRLMTTKQYRDGTSWTTQDELDYLAGLGSYHLNSRRVSRLACLQRYLDAMSLRADWQKMDVVVVRAEAMRLIRLEQQRESRKAA